MAKKPKLTLAELIELSHLPKQGRDLSGEHTNKGLLKAIPVVQDTIAAEMLLAAKGNAAAATRARKAILFYKNLLLPTLLKRMKSIVAEGKAVEAKTAKVNGKKDAK